MAQSSTVVVENGGISPAGDFPTLWENVRKQSELRGLSFREIARKIGINHKTLFELKKAAEGLEFSLGRKALFKIRRFITNQKRGERKPKARRYRPLSDLPGHLAPDAV